MHKNASVAHIVLAAVSVTWFGMSGHVVFWSGFVWAGAMTLILGLAFPAASKGATPQTARCRCWQRVKHDPMSCFALATFVFFGLQALNSGRELVYDSVTELWSYGAPVWLWAPAGVTVGPAWQAMAVVFVFFCCCLAVRHTMNRRRRLLVLQGISLNGALLALWLLVRSVVQHKAGVSALPAFVFASSSSAAVGAYYVLMTAVSTALVLDAVARKRFSVWLVLPLILNYAGVLLSGSGAAVIAVWTYVIVMCVYALFYVRPWLVALDKRRTGLWGAGACALFFGLVHMIVSPVFKVTGGGGLNFGFAALSAWKQEVVSTSGTAFRIWLDHPWFGVGPKGFTAFAPFYDLPATSAAGNHVTDAVASLCAYGVIGCGLMVLAVGAMLVSHARRLALLPQVTSGAAGAPVRGLIFRLVPTAVALLTGTGAVVCALGCTATVFNDPMVSLSWGITVAGLGSFLPLRTQV